jgi:triosephosphate isomerase
MTNNKDEKLIGISLKMYMDRVATIKWAEAVKSKIQNHEAIRSQAVRVFILPSFPLIADVLQVMNGTEIQVGAQNLFYEDSGAYTGEVSPVVLRQLGCDYVSIGHHERRTYFEENDDQIGKKTLAAFRNNIVPVICVGEELFVDDESAELETISQIQSALLFSNEYKESPTVIAYEPSWAIGAQIPATAAHINRLCGAIQSELHQLGFTKTWVIYGGSAGPGLYTQVKENVNGLFLGRMAHDPEAVLTVLNEFWIEKPVAGVL